MTLSFERKLRGRKRGGRCVTTARRGARCSLYRRAGAKLSVDATAGLNSLRLSRRALPAGSYRLTLVAADRSGNRSAAVRAGFRLVEAATTRRSRAAVVVTAIRRLRLAF